MAETALQAVNVAMRGGGYYSRANQSAKDVIDSATPLVLEAIHRLPDTNTTTPFTLTDMGCADGGTSLDMMRQVFAAVRVRWPRRQICVIYTDTPGNDYNILFQILHGLTSFPTYLDEIEDVHVQASATSFYKRILPVGSLHLGFSANAMHWPSHKPCDLTEHIHAVGASGTELAAFAEQGRLDWETILLHRAQELVPGGRLVLVNMCQDEAGRFLGNTGGVNMYDALNALWRRFVAERVIRGEEYVRVTLPHIYRTVEECIQPLTDLESPVYRAGLRLEQWETRVVPCPFAAAFGGHGDAARFAREYVPSFRSWTESTFLAALAPERPLEERQEIVERYYGAYEAMVRENPADHRKDLVHIYMTIAKTGA
jgi:hypothetical protein